MVIKPFEMAMIYWRFKKKYSVAEVQLLIKGLSGSIKTKKYWDEVLMYLNFKLDERKPKH